MRKITELGEELYMDLVRVHDKVCGQVHEKERARMSEGEENPFI